MAHALRKLSLLMGAFLGVLLIVGLPTWGQEAVEPSGEIATAECYGHHKQEGFRSMDLFPTVVTEVPKGQQFTFQLTIKNPWLNDLQRTVGYVNTSDAPGLSFPGARDPVAAALDGTAQNGAAGPTHPLTVDANATQLVVSMVGQAANVPGPLGSRANGVDYALALESPDGSIKLTDTTQKVPESSPAVTNGRTTQLISVDQTNLTKGGIGAWKATVRYNGIQPTGTYKLAATVYYNLSQVQELVVAGPALLKPGESFTFSFTINAKDVEALQKMRYGGRATAYHAHTDKAIGDLGDYDKWNTMEFKTGATLSMGSANVAKGNSVSLMEPVLRRWGQVLGFTGAFLIIPSLVFGGTLGKQTVEPLNSMFGGARRRVLFHNSMSFWLLGVALLHMFLFFYEAFWNWSHGLVWGGLSLAAMVGLGVTGAMQRSFVARWGFTRWRFIHFAMGILVFVFVLIHVTVDGSHLAPIRNALLGVDPSRVGS
ncbi:MAG: ferric reductase-like transmembrane domain-containing protein [Candidatus Thermoplasmatota archaeon]